VCGEGEREGGVGWLNRERIWCRRSQRWRRHRV
jgi:hypothetical protein